MKTQDKVSALAKHLNIETDDIGRVNYADSIFTTNGGEYLVVTDAEATKACKEQLRDSMWAFSIDFIASHSRMELSTRAKAAIVKMQSELCEDCNEIIACLVKSITAFINDAIKADGRGHALAGYDHEEIELENGLFAYRVN